VAQEAPGVSLLGRSSELDLPDLDGAVRALEVDPLALFHRVVLVHVPKRDLVERVGLEIAGHEREVVSCREVAAGEAVAVRIDVLDVRVADVPSLVLPCPGLPGSAGAALPAKERQEGDELCIQEQHDEQCDEVENDAHGALLFEGRTRGRNSTLPYLPL